MNDLDQNQERDEILFALHKEYTNPSAEQIILWVNRYPQYADDIRSHAAIIKDWAAREIMPVLEPSEAMLSRGQSRAMDALYKAQTASVAQQSGATASTFDQIMASRGTDVPELSRKLDVSRGVLSALVSGRMLPPVGERLVAAMTNYLAISREVFNSALQFACATPRLGHAKAEGTPNVIPRSYEDLVRASSMPADRKQFWLGEE
jgi:hypothetical protein